MNKSEYINVIHASKEKTWDVLFNQYGEIHIHNPTMQSSNYLNGGKKGELNSIRHCMFSDKIFLDEKIVDVQGNDSFTIEVTDHNLPFVNKMSATYTLRSIEPERTELKMVSYNSFSPRFMKHVMRKPMSKSLMKHLFGLKYYLETDKIVTRENYNEIFKNYN